MLRCPPTTIVLGRSDLLEYDKRKRNRGLVSTESIEQHLARMAVGDPDGSLTEPERRLNHHRSQAHKDEEDSTDSPSCYSDETSTESTTSHLDEEAVEAQSEMLRDLMEAECLSENPTRWSRVQCPPIKNEFDYGGFIDYPPLQNTDTTSQTTTAFSRDDLTTTPQSAQHTELRRLRHRPLPRSPLFLSQNATSPEGRLTTGLTPRVVSRVANHNSPGMIFAQPPRRPPRSNPTPDFTPRALSIDTPGQIFTEPPRRLTRTAPRALRHQTNSFSFDSSERASAAYEQERVISNSTDDDAAYPSEGTRLHDELRSSSLQSSRISSGVPILHELEDNVESGQESQVSDINSVILSPGFSLPPPFSSVSRRTSDAGSLPSSAHDRTSPLRRNPISPDRDQVESLQAKLLASPATAISDASESPPSGSRLGAFISRISRAASYRAKSPLHRRASPVSSSHGQQAVPVECETPRRYRVYNDNLSPATQPQTPANLPESRHQSRYHASYTAPVTRQVTHPTTADRAANRTSLRRREPRPVYTPVRGGHRTASPTGMREAGFEGLYGGEENGDDEQRWAEGVRFNNAETRLWGQRDARNNDGALRVTPEPEDWRVGRRN